MKRKIAYLLVGVLALTPVTTGMTSLQAHADAIVSDANLTDSSISEEESTTEISDASIKVTIKDAKNNTLELTKDAPLTLLVDETATPVVEFAEQEDANEDAEQSIKIEWKIAQCEIACVDENGTFTALSAGETLVTAVITEGDSIKEVSFNLVVAEEEEVMADGTETSDEAVSTEATEAAATEVVSAEEASTTSTAEEVDATDETVEATTTDETVEEVVTTEATAEETVVVEETTEGEVEFSALQASVAKSGAAYSWVTTGSTKMYQDANGNYKTGWLKDNGSWYYLDSKGAMKTGWITDRGTRFYLGENGVMKTGWLKDNGSWYYLASSGAMKTGWVKDKNTWYYLDESGVMQIGWQKVKNTWYYLASSGAMKTGWVKDKNIWYYLDESGAMTTDWQKVNGIWYYLNSWGGMKTGWLKDNGSWYYLTNSGAMKTGWLSVGSDVYYLNGSGKMLTGVQKIGSSTYVFETNGRYISPSTKGYKNTQEFIAIIAPLVKAYAPEYGVKVYSPIIAQAILESASGQSTLGKNYNNFFGLKCGTLWKGKSVAKKTGEEYTVGNYTTITANFRVYDSIPEGVKGYFEFLFNGRTRYNNLKGVTNPQVYLQNIKADGYATSSTYVKNLMRVISTYNLTAYDN